MLARCGTLLHLWTGPLTILVVPLTEFLLFRFWLHSILKIQIGFPFLTDYDFVCPGLLAFFILMIRLQEGEPLRLKWQGHQALAHAALVGIFVGLSLLYPFLKTAGLVGLWYGAAAVALGSGFFVFVEVRYYFARRNWCRVLAAIPIASSKVIARQVFSVLWVPAMHVTGTLVYGALRPIFSNLSRTTYLTHRQEEYVHVSNGTYTLAIGVGCSGLEGVGFVAAALLFTLMLDPKRLTPFSWVNCFLVGILGFYLLNVLRLSLVFSLATLLLKYWGHDVAMITALALVHDSMGWLLHGLGFLILYRWIYSEKAALRFRIPVFRPAGITLIYLVSFPLLAAIEPPEHKLIDPWSIPPLQLSETTSPPPMIDSPEEAFSGPFLQPRTAVVPSCDDFALAATTCQAGAATWRYVLSSMHTLFLEGTCDTQCTCGNVPVTGGVCYGCGYQSEWQTTKCYSNTGCTNACTPAPQFPEGWTGVGWIVSALVPFWFYCRKRSSVSTRRNYTL
ncbi:MAG: hypothetical protein HYR96_05955 [Deltaproteobacteria bacterium]|nr:hypothetical protein [Deltaproteobacteria bacterium]MBI3296102.1 hypothetical protein [Deltaproteobacteria bacterium]